MVVSSKDIKTLNFNNIEIPVEILNAREDGRLILFCGSGVSKNADYPLFGELVDEIYRKLGHQYYKIDRSYQNHKKIDKITPVNYIEKRFLDNQEYDRVLGYLENSYNGSSHNIRGIVKEILGKEPKSVNIHKRIINIATTKEGEVRVVTTNYDRAFQRTGLINNDRAHRPPSLRTLSPKDEAFRELTYLHGFVDDSEKVILTSKDMTSAYISDGWATRFIKELIENYTILFLGYSLEDTLVNYLIEEVNSSELSNIYVLDSYSSKNMKSIKEEKWKNLNITPIFYRELPKGEYRGFSDFLNGIYDWINKDKKSWLNDIRKNIYNIKTQQKYILYWLDRHPEDLPFLLGGGEDIASIDFLELVEKLECLKFGELYGKYTTKNPSKLSIQQEAFVKWTCNFMDNLSFQKWLVGLKESRHFEAGGRAVIHREAIEIYRAHLENNMERFSKKNRRFWNVVLMERYDNREELDRAEYILLNVDKLKAPLNSSDISLILKALKPICYISNFLNESSSIGVKYEIRDSSILEIGENRELLNELFFDLVSLLLLHIELKQSDGYTYLCQNLLYLEKGKKKREYELVAEYKPVILHLLKDCLFDDTAYIKDITSWYEKPVLFCRLALATFYKHDKLDAAYEFLSKMSNKQLYRITIYASEIYIILEWLLKSGRVIGTLMERILYANKRMRREDTIWKYYSYLKDFEEWQPTESWLREIDVIEDKNPGLKCFDRNEIIKGDSIGEAFTSRPNYFKNIETLDDLKKYSSAPNYLNHIEQAGVLADSNPALWDEARESGMFYVNTILSTLPCNREESSKKLKKRVADLDELTRFSNKIDTYYRLSQWLESNSDLLDDSDFYRFWDYVYEGVIINESYKEPLNITFQLYNVNHKVGDIFRILISRAKERKNQELFLTDRLERFLADAKRSNFFDGFSILGSEFDNLYEIDKNWINKFLVPLFKTKNRKIKRAMWEGYSFREKMFYGRKYFKNLLGFEIDFIKLFTNNPEEEIGSMEQSILSYLFIYNPIEINRRVLSKYLENINHKIKVRILATFANSDIPDEKVIYFFKNIWPSRKQYQSVEYRSSLFGLLQKADSPKALWEAIEPFWEKDVPSFIENREFNELKESKDIDFFLNFFIEHLYAFNQGLLKWQLRALDLNTLSLDSKNRYDKLVNLLENNQKE